MPRAMAMSSQASESQPQPLPVALSLDLPPSPRCEIPVLSIPCAPIVQAQPAGPSWSDLLGER